MLFVTIGSFIKIEKYPGSLSDVIGNITAFKTSYNAECWFLFPYSLLVLSSPFLFNFQKFGWKLLLFSFIFNIGITFLISRFGEMYLYSNMIIYNPLLYFHLMFPFLLGAGFEKFNFRVPFEQIIFNKRLIWIFIILLFAIPCIINLSVLYSFYAFTFIIIFKEAPTWKWVYRVLSVLGSHSMNMWLIHTWFAYYLFHDFIYGFKYPLVFLCTYNYKFIDINLCELFGCPFIKIYKKITFKHHYRL